MSYALPLPWYPDERDVRPLWADIPLPGDTLINVATTTDFITPLTTGMELSLTETVSAVSAEKRTRLGLGSFVSTSSVYEADGNVVATHENVMLRYRSNSAADAGAASSPPAPVSSLGEIAASVEIPVTLEQCVLNVSATQDFFPGHYDTGYAHSQGVRSVFLNTMFFQGLVDQLARQVAGPGWRVRRRGLRMRSSACLGDTVQGYALRPADNVVGTHPAVTVIVDTEHGRCAEARVDLQAEE
jgi:hypothetical protein